MDETGCWETTIDPAKIGWPSRFTTTPRDRCRPLPLCLDSFVKHFRPSQTFEKNAPKLSVSLHRLNRAQRVSGGIMSLHLAPWGLSAVLFAAILSAFFGLSICSMVESPRDDPNLAAVRAADGDEVRSSTSFGQPPPQLTSTGQLGVPNPFIEPVEIHHVLVTVEDEKPRIAPLPRTSRHVQEKTRLLDRLKRDEGTWNNHHPRHRLLDALYGYSRYYQRQKEELERLRGLYTKVNKKQHKVNIPHHLKKHWY